MKKKLLAGLLASVMVFSLTACGGGGDQESSGGDSDGPYTVTMVLQGTQQPDEERIEGKINEILEKRSSVGERNAAAAADALRR